MSEKEGAFALNTNVACSSDLADASTNRMLSNMEYNNIPDGRNISRRRNAYLSELLSCTSSTIMCVTELNCGSLDSLCSKMPVVQNNSLVNFETLLSRRIWYPIVFPIRSSLSAATLSATPIALILRG